MYICFVSSDELALISYISWSYVDSPSLRRPDLEVEIMELHAEKISRRTSSLSLSSKPHCSRTHGNHTRRNLEASRIRAPAIY